MNLVDSKESHWVLQSHAYKYLCNLFSNGAEGTKRIPQMYFKQLVLEFLKISVAFQV